VCVCVRLCLQERRGSVSTSMSECNYLLIFWFRFRISPAAFFQVNVAATELLYKVVREMCGPIDESTIIFDIHMWLPLYVCFDFVFLVSWWHVRI